MEALEHKLAREKIVEYLKARNYKVFVGGLSLKSGRRIKPDLMAVNGSEKLAIEITWEGERKEDYFDDLLDGWTGVNVFITKNRSKDFIVNPFGGIAEIEWKEKIS